MLQSIDSRCVLVLAKGLHIILKRALTRMSLSALAAVCSHGLAAAGTTVYSCTSQEYCRCNADRGCKSLDPILNPDFRPSCDATDRMFQATVKARDLKLEGKGLSITFRETRPYFGDFDWYQNGQNDERGLLNFSFDNESLTTPFLLKEMVRGSINDFVWTLSGTCRVSS